jgi:hypothetical protein
MTGLGLTCNGVDLVFLRQVGLEQAGRARALAVEPCSCTQAEEIILASF